MSYKSAGLAITSGVLLSQHGVGNTVHNACMCAYCGLALTKGRICDKHEKRLARYGSATAMRCQRCKTIHDDKYTAELRDGRQWLCPSCAPKYCDYELCHKYARWNGKYCNKKHEALDKLQEAAEERMLEELEKA